MPPLEKMLLTSGPHQCHTETRGHMPSYTMTWGRWLSLASTATVAKLPTTAWAHAWWQPILLGQHHNGLPKSGLSASSLFPFQPQHSGPVTLNYKLFTRSPGQRPSHDDSGLQQCRKHSSVAAGGRTENRRGIKDGEHLRTVCHT